MIVSKFTRTTKKSLLFSLFFIFLREGVNVVKGRRREWIPGKQGILHNYKRVVSREGEGGRREGRRREGRRRIEREMQ